MDIIDKVQLQAQYNNFQKTEQQLVSDIMEVTRAVVGNEEGLNVATNKLLQSKQSIQRLNQIEFLFLMSEMTGVSFEDYINALKNEGYYLSPDESKLVSSLLNTLNTTASEELVGEFEIDNLPNNPYIENFKDIEILPDRVVIHFKDIGSFVYRRDMTATPLETDFQLPIEVELEKLDKEFNQASLQELVQPLTISEEPPPPDTPEPLEEFNLEELPEESQSQPLDTQEPLEEFNLEELPDEPLEEQSSEEPLEEFNLEELPLEEELLEEFALEELPEEQSSEEPILEEINLPVDISPITTSIENTLGVISPDNQKLTPNHTDITQYVTYNVDDRKEGEDDGFI